MQLVDESGVHGEIAFVDRDAEGSKDGSDCAAVFECAADDAERGVVEDDSAIGVREETGGGRGGGESEAVRPGAEDGGRETDAVEDGRFLGSGGRGNGRGIGIRIFAAEVLNVFEGGAGEVARTRFRRRLNSGRRSQPLRPHEREIAE